MSIYVDDLRLHSIKKQTEDIPLQQRLLSGFLSLSSTPYRYNQNDLNKSLIVFSLYMPSPRTFLHTVDPRIKQVLRRFNGLHWFVR